MSNSDLMRWSALAAILAAGLLSVGASIFLALYLGEEAEAQPATPPNILYIVLDDADVENMENYMPETTALVRDQGVSFTNFYVAQPVCCPSRASALLGEYPHNTGVSDNNPPNGGWATFRNRGQQTRTVGVEMQNKGYRTALIGKYLNGYMNTRHVPQGWDTWFGKWNQRAYDWKATNTNGKVETFGDKKRAFRDRVVMRKGANFAEEAAEPFFLYSAPQAPHSPYTDPPGDHGGGSYSPPPSYNEQDVSDKPKTIRDRGVLGGRDRKAIENRHSKRAKITRYLDTQIASMLTRLETAGRLENTYVVVTSDNGWFEGEHRIPKSKSKAYEEASHVPLWIRGPGISPGTTVDELASNVDLFATFGDMAGEPSDLRDGVNLLPAAQGQVYDRSRVLIESDPQGYVAMVDTTHDGRRLKYVEHDTGEKELYDLDVDPYELESLHDDEDPGLLSQLSADLAALASCAGVGCR